MVNNNFIAYQLAKILTDIQGKFQPALEVTCVLISHMGMAAFQYINDIDDYRTVKQFITRIKMLRHKFAQRRHFMRNHLGLLFKQSIRC